MKKLLSILLVFSMFFTLTTGFAATAPKKTAAVSTTFTAISDIYGVWVTADDQMFIDKTGLYALSRTPGTMTFTTAIMTNPKTPFKLSKDKKVITVTLVSPEDNLSVDCNFKKDAKGNVIFGLNMDNKFVQTKIVSYYKTRAEFEKAQAASPAVLKLIEQEKVLLAAEKEQTNFFMNKITAQKPLLGKFDSPNGITADFTADKLVLTNKDGATEFKLDYTGFKATVTTVENFGLIGVYTIPVTYTFEGKEGKATLVYAFDLDNQLYIASWDTTEAKKPAILEDSKAEEAQPFKAK